MDWQEPAALLVVGGTVLIMLVQRVRTFRRRGVRKCASGCHCPPLASTDTKPYLDTPPIVTENRS
jgi:hypothetical protein